MATEKGLNTTAVCWQLGYSKQAYYKTKKLNLTKLNDQAKVKQRVLSIRATMPRIGTRKLYYLLQEAFKSDGIKMGRDSLFRLLKEEHLLIQKKRKYTITTDSKHFMFKHPNLVKELVVKRPEQVWVADITYIPVAKGFNYLHLITDAYSKKIVGYEMCDNMTTISTQKALKMALKGRLYHDKLIHHSDRGLQYCSALYTGLLKENNIDISMTIDGDPYENAVAERVNGILKDEFGLSDPISTPYEAEKMVRQAVEIYNTQRPHLSNHYVTPMKMHEQSQIVPKLWHKKGRSTLQSAPPSVSLFIN